MSLCPVGLVKDLVGHLVNQPRHTWQTLATTCREHMRIRSHGVVAQYRPRVEESAQRVSQPAPAGNGADMSYLQALHYMTAEQ